MSTCHCSFTNSTSLAGGITAYRPTPRESYMYSELPPDDIRPTFVNHLEHQEFPELFSTREELSLVEIKEYFKDQWIENTDPNFLSVFGTKINSTNALETYNKKLNAHVGSKRPNIWVFITAMNEMLLI
jgi:hypothetical protein